jgi:hypothetical protein
MHKNIEQRGFKSKTAVPSSPANYRFNNFPSTVSITDIETNDASAHGTALKSSTRPESAILTQGADMSF